MGVGYCGTARHGGKLLHTGICHPVEEFYDIGSAHRGLYARLRATTTFDIVVEDG
jgi:hypothetical protein